MTLSDELLRPLRSYALRRGCGAPSAVCAASTAFHPNGTSGSTAGASPDDLADRFRLLRSVGEECQTEAEMKTLLATKPDFILYDGFEPSGRMHIAQGIFKAMNVNKCTAAGGTFIFWVADWFALMNDKMGGDLEKIKTVGKYLIEVWRASGMDMSRVKFLWCADEINAHAKAYWMQAMDIARRSTLARIKKCCQIMGRKEGSLTAAQILYPIMQCTDIFFLKADICQLGVDQRKVNMLARDYCDASGRKAKPIILSHHMLYGLKAGQAKMSKSDPDSAVFMEDTPEDVRRKVMNAYCPTKPEEAAQAAADAEEMQLEKDELKNPCLDYVKNILFSKAGYSFPVGNVRYASFEEVKEAFVAGKISEDVLKNVIIDEVNALLDPVRKHFKTDPTARDLLAKITQWKKENLKPESGSTTRVRAMAAGAPRAFVVFAPQPRESVSFEAVLGVLRRLQQAPANSEVVLFFEDWSSFTLGRTSAETSCIRGFYELLAHGLRSLAPELMAKVRVLYQEDMILQDPNNYWISVINAGRAFNLEDIREALPAGESLENASQVFAALMHVGDVMALCGDAGPIICADEHHAGLHALAARHVERCGLPKVEICEQATPRLRLLQDGEGTEADANLFLTDNEINVNKKLKKAFCQPGNIEVCPPLAWVRELCGFQELQVTRKPENGGDKTFASPADVSADFASGALHPGDLKPALARLVNAVLERVRPGLKDLDALKNAQKDLENLAKKNQKKK